MPGDSGFAIRKLNEALLGIKEKFSILSSGKRINKASDDAAGLAIAESLDALATQRGVGIRNAQDGISAGQIAESSLSVISDAASGIRLLATQAANGTYTPEQRAELQEQVAALRSSVGQIAQNTTFNGKQLLTSGEGVSYQVGTGSGEGSQITVEGTDISSLVAGLDSIDISTQAGADAALAAVSSFESNISSVRGRYGAAEARLNLSASTNAVQRENELAASSRIRDADIATEVAALTRLNILADSAKAVIGQAGRLNADTIRKLLT